MEIEKQSKDDFKSGKKTVKKTVKKRRNSKKSNYKASANNVDKELAPYLSSEEDKT